MEQKCETCGEPLYGAVNRCWQCGEPVKLVVAPPKIPPVRRAPVNLASEADLPAETSLRLPFPFSVDMSPSVRHACTVTSVALSAVGCLIGIASGWSLLLGTVALGCGLLGMQDTRKRDLATMGLVLSVIAIFLGAGQIGFDAWTKYESQRWIKELQGVQAQ